MKHLTQTEVSLFDRLIDAANLTVAAHMRLTMMEYLDAVLEANLTLNLTRITNPSDGVRLHVLDSLLALPALDAAPPGTLLDIGTGAGFPGVPLCLASARQGRLLDSVGKKARAVNGILEALGLEPQVVAVHERAEEHAQRHPGRYAAVTARAVSELPALVELASPLLSEGGQLLAFKGAPSESELDRGRKAAALAGMREIRMEQMSLPLGGESRCIVVYERQGASRTKLPRRPGDAQRFPLA